MEQFLRDRILLRRNKLEEDMKLAEQVLLQCKNEGQVLEQDIVKIRLKLKQSIINLENDMSKYISTNTEQTDILSPALEIQMKAEDILIELESVITIHIKNVETHHSKSTTVKLPKLELQKFDGDVLKWTEFWDRFSANVDTQNLKDSEKLAYLLSLLENEAKDAVQGLTMNNSNYQVAVDTLKNRYGNKEKVIDTHYESLNKLKCCEYTSEQCRKNLNLIETHLRVLASLGEDIEANFLRSLILEKFPERVIYELNILLANDQSITNIRKTLDTIVTALGKSKLRETPTPATTPATTEAFISFSNKPTYRKGKRLPGLRPFNNITGPRKRKAETAINTISGNKKPKLSCIFCSEHHYNDECTKVKDIEDRKKKLSNRCFICLKLGHQANNCKRRKKCYHCKGNHNRALCPKGSELGKEGNPITKPTLNVVGSCPKAESFLQTATAQVVHKNRHQTCRILLDCGSQRSYITTGLAKNLDMTTENVDSLIIFTFGVDKPTEILSPCTDIDIKTKRGIDKTIHVNIVPRITDRIPIQSIPKTDFVDLFADHGSETNQPINMLIGNDYYFSFIRNNIIQINSDLYLVDTDFGWVISGRLDKENQKEENVLAVVTYHQSNRGCKCYTEPDLPLRQSDLKFLWSLESIGITDSVKATREEAAVQHFNDTVLYQEGRYYVKWPWTTYPPEVPTNYGLAYGRLKGLLQRLDKPTLQEYQDILMGQLKAEIVEIVKVDTDVQCQSVPPVHYLSHHIVKQNSKPGRIVYDGSARLKDQQSLNECMYRGPCMLQDLTALLLNFRVYKVAIIADVEKAFLQIGLQEEDREVTRFLWLKDINKPISDDNLLHLRFCRMPFGIISSPFLLTATIRYHISKKNSDLLKRVANKCYVDNLVTGTNTTKEALQLYDETRNTFEELSMNLRDWTSNDEPFLQKISEPHRAKESNEIKVLGLLWNKKQDVLTLNVQKEVLTDDSTRKVTKREVLRVLASVYDPCGIVSPLLMPIKLFLQELWRKDYKWDAALPQELLLKWKKIIDNLDGIKEVNIPRYVQANDSEGSENELHCFADAAKDSYAAVVYFRTSSGSEVKTSFLLSKSRIAPLEKKPKEGKKNDKKLTIPQLELLGCVIGNRLLTYLKNTIELPISRQYLWTDSLIALNWINSNKLLPPFITNRVEEIKKNVGLLTCYVNTKDNPADIATRPELWTQKKHAWLEGPSFLSKNKSEWPKDIHLSSHQELASLPAVVEGLKEQSSDSNMPGEPASNDGQNEKSLDCDMPLPAINNDEPRSDNNEMRSQVQEIKNLQERFFPEEVKGKRTDLARNLGLFTDVDGLLRCKGRMMHANWSYDMRYPILLPRECDFTRSVVKEIHEKNYHVGASHTLNLVRQKFWIPRGRPVVERVLRKCPQCVKHGGGPYPLPPTPALPAERANYSTPFTYTGIDYFGPMYVNTENGQQKRWVCLFTCLAVRAIHMEVVKNLTADECIMALRRFISARGLPGVIVSDNALYFKLSSEILNNEHCVKNNIRWKFIPQLAPWHGAFYERLVGLVKHCLKRTLEKCLLNDTQLQTVIKETENVVNSRPLTRVGPDMDVVLKPSDFLSLGSCLNLEILDGYKPEETDTLVKQNLLESWKRGQNMLNHFKNMFINQYLTSLRERYQHSHKQPRVKSHKEPNIGDLVQIKGESKNRINWKVGKIVQLIRGSDGYCRIAHVQVGESIFKRSIGHLYPLELEDPPSTQDETTEAMEPQARVLDCVEKEPVNIQIYERPEEDKETETLPDKLRSSEISPQCVEIERDSEASDKRDSPTKSKLPDNEMSNEVSAPLEDPSNITDIIMQDEVQPQEVTRRAAAIRARERIAEWTRQLFAIL